MKEIRRERILVLPKRSLWSLLQHRRVRSADALAAEERQAGRQPEGKIESHRRQEETWEVLRQLFSFEQMPAREWLTPDLVREYDAVLVAGGDNHLQFVAQYVPTGIPIIGVNSDARAGGSHGGLLSFGPEQLPDLLTCLETGAYRLEQWPRLEIIVDEEEPMFALSQLRFVSPDPDRTTRVQFSLSSIGARQTPPSTGFIVSSPAGKTGHLSSACRYLPKRLRQEAKTNWSRTTRRAQYLVQEPFVGGKELDEDFSEEEVDQMGLFGAFVEDDEMLVTSGMFDGQVRIDTEWTIAFSSDARARIRIATDRDLLVVSGVDV